MTLVALSLPHSLPHSLPQALSTLRQYTPHLTAVGVCILLGIALGILRMNAAANVPEQAERWALPKITPPTIVDLTAEQIAARFWSEQPRAAKTKAVVEVKKPVEQWRFVGTVDQGATLLAVIETAGKISRLKIGQTLPDGAVITEITEGKLSIDRQGTPQTLLLFVEKKPE